MQTGSQLHSLFVVILLCCAPSQPLQLWEQHQQSICDDLHNQLIHGHHIENPSEAQMHDFGVY
ncbi:hypothetical protein PISMIDRAFT_44043, partial [Pisolithus microcarpus 441]